MSERIELHPALTGFVTKVMQQRADDGDKIAAYVVALLKLGEELAERVVQSTESCNPCEANDETCNPLCINRQCLIEHARNAGWPREAQHE